MFKGLGNMMSLMKNAGEIQEKMKEAQKQLGEITCTGLAGGGMVAVEMNGLQKVTRVSIDNTLLENPDRVTIEELVAAATNVAIDKARAAAAEKIAEATGTAGVPGLQDAFGQFMGGGSPGE